MPHRTTPPPVARSGLLLEREQELEAFAQAIAAAERGAGRIAVVRAPPGAGKTQLIGHARHTARKRC